MEMMMSAVWLASIFWPILTIIGIWLVTNPKNLPVLWKSVKESPALLYIGGVLNLLIGFTILSIYRTWSFELAVLVTLLGYIQVLRGIMIFFFTGWLKKFSDKLVSHAMVAHIGWIPLVWGLLLGWLVMMY